MAEIRRGYGGDGFRNERLPWLEPVENEEDQGPEPGSGGRFALWVAIALAAIVLAVGGFVWISRYRAAHADIGEVIHAPPGPYKEKPANPGGLQVDEGQVIAEKMGTGTDINSPLDLSKLPEEPIAGPRASAPVPPRPQPAPAARPAASASISKAPSPAPIPLVPPAPPKPAAPPAPPVPAPAAAAPGGGTIQLGALGSEAKAKQVWKSLSSRFAFLQPLTMSVTPVKVDDKTLYRLRAGGGDARQICAKLRVAGEACNVVE